MTDVVAPETSISRRSGMVLACMCLCTVLVVGFVASINLAVPTLAASSLHPSSAALLWIVDAYVVLFACLVIPAGALGDRRGHKTVLLAGLGLFALGAAVSAVAPTVAVLVAGRMVTGVGAACVLPNCLATLIAATPVSRRAHAIATWAAVSGIGGVIGNVGGGALLQVGSWRVLFTVVAPLALLCAVWVATVAPAGTRSHTQLSPWAALLVTAATLSLLLGITMGPQRGWTDVLVMAGFVGAVVLLVGWWAVEWHAAHPMLDPRLFGTAGLRSACAGMLLAFFGSYGLFYLNASLLQFGRGYSVLYAGMAIVPVTVPLLLAGRAVPRMVGRCGVVLTLALAFSLCGVSLLGLASATQARYPVYGLWLLLFGTGLALAIPVLTAEITAAVPAHRLGVGTGLQSTTRELGSALGVAVIGTLVTTNFTAHLPHQAQQSHTVPEALSALPTAGHDAVIEAFVSGSATALRIAGLVVLVVGALVCSDLGWSVRRARTPRTPGRHPAAPVGATDHLTATGSDT